MIDSAGGQCSQRGVSNNVNEAIKVLQLNAQHAKQAQLGINNWIDKQKQGKYIILVQEPYIYKQKVSMQPKTAIKYTGGNGNSPRTSIYTHPSIPAWYIDHISDRDASVIACKLNNRTTLIVSLYMDYNQNDPVIQHTIWSRNK